MVMTSHGILNHADRADFATQNPSECDIAGLRNECSKNRERTARTLWASPVPAIDVLRTLFYGALGVPSLRTEHFAGQVS